jgi:hypothetical protein
LLSDLADNEECMPVLDRILAAVAQEVPLASAIISTSASVGVTLFPQDDADADTLLRHADQAMYQAKEAGKNRYQLFDPESDRKAQLHRRMLEAWDRLCSNSNSCFTTSPRWIWKTVADRPGSTHPLAASERPAGPADFLPVLQGSALEITLAAGYWSRA